MSGDEGVDVARQYDHRHTAALHDLVVELTEVELCAQGLLGLGAHAVDLAVADLVAAGLARPGAITIDFARHFLDARAVRGGEPVDRLLTRPALRMQAGVDDEPARAERDRLQVAQAPIRIVV